MSSAMDGGERPELLVVNIVLHTRLYRCAACGCYWEENERYANVMSESTVHADYPDLEKKKR